MRPVISGAVRASLVAAICFGIAGCGKPEDDLRRLAASGETDRTAPVQAAVEGILAAPPETVWRIIGDVPRWPRWWPGVTAASIAGPFVAGTNFAFSEGVAISAWLALAQPPTQVAWVGHAWTVQAIHVWKFDAVPGGTRVRVTESMSGFPIGWLFSSADLRHNLEDSLAGLRRAAAARRP